MIGNDCKLLEDNIDVFLDTFIKKDCGETWNSQSAIKLKQILNLYVSCLISNQGFTVVQNYLRISKQEQKMFVKHQPK